MHDWDMASVLAAFAGITAHAGPRPGGQVAAFIAEGLLW